MRDRKRQSRSGLPVPEERLAVKANLRGMFRLITMKEYTVKILSFNPSNQDANAAICMSDLVIGGSIDDQAFFYSGSYMDIFHTTRKKACRERKLLSVVKIKFNGNTIHRRIQSSRFIKNIGRDDIGLSSASISLLAENGHPVVGETVRVSKGNKLAYWWYHPFHAARVSFRLGVIALIVTSLLGIIQFFV